MCGLCGDLSGRPNWTQAAAGDGGQAQARHRIRCLADARALMSTRGLLLTGWSRRYVVADKRGRSILADDLPACWVAAERLAGDPVDPLAPEALASLRPSGPG